MSSRRAKIAAAAAVGGALAAVVAAGVVLAGGSEGDAGVSGAAAPTTPPGALRAAPALRGTDPVTGRKVDLASFRGKPVVVNVWASWCPGCNDEAEDLRRFAAEHPEAVVLGLDFQDTFAGARAFYERWAWKHPSVFDSSGSLTAAWGLQGLPTTYFLTPEHEIAAQVVGASDFAGFEQGLEAARQASGS